MFGRNVGRKCVFYIRASQVANYSSDFDGFYKKKNEFYVGVQNTTSHLQLESPGLQSELFGSYRKSIFHLRPISSCILLKGCIQWKKNEFASL